MCRPCISHTDGKQVYGRWASGTGQGVFLAIAGPAACENWTVDLHANMSVVSKLHNNYNYLLWGAVCVKIRYLGIPSIFIRTIDI